MKLIDSSSVGHSRATSPRLSARYAKHLATGDWGGLVREDPWPHFVLDDLLEPADSAPMRERVLANAEPFDVDPYLGLNIQMQYLNDIELAEFFFSDDAWALFEAIAGHRLKADETAAIQLRRMTPDSPKMTAHVDAQIPGSLAVIYYLSDGWAPGRGGELTLLKHARDPGGLKIAPRANRLVAFATEPHHWHAVARVRDWERYAVILSLLPA